MSVIIPSFEGWPLLKRTLLAVIYDCARQNSLWEVVIVDNESSPETVKTMLALAHSVDGLRVILRSGLVGGNFQPGAARNIGIEAARYDSLVFLDADCVPAAGTLRTYREATRQDVRTVFVGHRQFIDSAAFSPVLVAEHRQVLDKALRIRSASNYRLVTDRRMPMLAALDSAERPFDCLHGCNFALHRDCLGTERFDQSFDGHWGYEDIELGYRLHRSGRRFRYLPDAYVYHQEHVCDEAVRTADRGRNFAIAASLIPGFAEYRRRSPRPCAVPLSVPGTAVHTPDQAVTR